MKKHLLSALAIVAAALLLRLWGVGWSLPYVDHPDEPAVMGVVLRILRIEPNPHHFFYPSLMFYLYALVLKLHFWLGGLTGVYPEGFTLPRTTHFYTTIPQAFIWARGFSALLGTGTVLAMAVWGSHIAGWRAGLIGAALLALSPSAIIHSHYITVDGPAACAGLLALLAIMQLLPSSTEDSPASPIPHHPSVFRGSWASYVLAGALVGLATGTKYQNAVVVVPFVLAHGFRWQSASLAYGLRLVVAGLVSVVVFLLTSPYIILDFTGFWHDIQTLFTSYEAGHGDIGHAWPVGDYLRFFWQEGLGPLPFLLMLIGAVALVRRNLPLALVLLSFPSLLIMILLSMQTHFYRNLLPSVPPLMLTAGIGAAAVWNYGRYHLPAHLVRTTAERALVVLLLPSLAFAIQSSLRFGWPDTRVVAQEWVRQNFPGVRVATELSHPMRWNGVAQSTYLHFLPLRSAEWYREQGYGLLLANASRRGKDEWSAAYQPLLEAGTVVATFGGRTSSYLGPRIDIIDSGLTPTRVPTYTQEVILGPVRLLGTTYGRLIEDTTGPELRADEPVRAGDILGITAFWMVNRLAPQANYMVFVHLRNQENQNVVQRDTPPWQGLFPLSNWRPGRLVVESLDLVLPSTLPSGSYRLVMGLYNSRDQTRYPAFMDGRRLSNDEVELGVVEVVP